MFIHLTFSKIFVMMDFLHKNRIFFILSKLFKRLLHVLLAYIFPSCRFSHVYFWTKNNEQDSFFIQKKKKKAKNLLKPI